MTSGSRHRHVGALPVNPDLKPPGNESREHFLLKQVALTFIRFNLGCRYCATELPTWRVPDPEKHPSLAAISKGYSITDVLGVGPDLAVAGRRHTMKDIGHVVRSVEVKVTRRDYHSGYSAGGDLNYLITPSGLVNGAELPDAMGLIEVDLAVLRWDRFAGPVGIKLAKKPRRITTVPSSPYVTRSVEHEAWAHGLIEAIAFVQTAQAVYANPWFYRGWTNIAHKHACDPAEGQVAEL